MTLQWLGAGIIPDVALPATIDAQHPLQLPCWQDGLTVSGHILNTDGTPYAHASILIGDARDEQNPEQFVLRTTDDDGRFSVKGVLPDTTLLILPPGAQNGFQDGQRSFHSSAAWLFQVPEAAAPEMTLRFNTSPTFVRLVETPRGTAWWLPEHGAPIHLSLYGDYQFPAGSAASGISPTMRAIPPVTPPSSHPVTTAWWCSRPSRARWDYFFPMMLSRVCPVRYAWKAWARSLASAAISV